MDAYQALAASYDRLTNDVDYEAIVAFYKEIIKREGVNPRTAIDLACGTGTVSCLLAEHGYDVIATDMSEEMLTQAAAKAAQQKTNTRAPAGGCKNFPYGFEKIFGCSRGIPLYKGSPRV